MFVLNLFSSKLSMSDAVVVVMVQPSPHNLFGKISRFPSTDNAPNSFPLFPPKTWSLTDNKLELSTWQIFGFLLEKASIFLNQLAYLSISLFEGHVRLKRSGCCFWIFIHAISPALMYKKWIYVLYHGLFKLPVMFFMDCFLYSGTETPVLVFLFLFSSS